MTRIIIAGAKGKMGQAFCALRENIPGLAVAGRIDLGQELAQVIPDGRRGR